MSDQKNPYGDMETYKVKRTECIEMLGQFAKLYENLVKIGSKNKLTAENKDKIAETLHRTHQLLAVFKKTDDKINTKKDDK